MVLLYIIGFTLLGSVGTLALAGTFLLVPGTIRNKFIPSLISYATGTLLGAAFIGLLPRVLVQLELEKGLLAVLGGIILFFILEKLVLWRHCHHSDCENHSSTGPLVIIGDSFHNFVDGVVIAAAFLTSIPLGIAAAFAIISHELPQEVGDFAILLDHGYNVKKALFYNFLSSMSALVGAVGGFYFLSELKTAIPYVMAISVSSFIYIAVADLFPNLHKHTRITTSVIQVVMILLGIATILFIHHLFGDVLHGHSH